MILEISSAVTNMGIRYAVRNCYLSSSICILCGSQKSHLTSLFARRCNHLVSGLAKKTGCTPPFQNVANQLGNRDDLVVTSPTLRIGDGGRADLN